MKKISLVLVLGLVLFSSFGFAAQKQKTIVVGISWNDKSQALITAWTDYMKTWGKTYKDVNFKWVSNVANNDPSQQASNIEDLIAQKVDAIVIRAEDTTAIASSIKACKKAGVKVITFDRECASEKPDAHVGADSYNQAKTTAYAFAKLLKSKGIKGKCIELLGDLKDMNAVQRSKGWHDVEKELGQWNTVVQVPTEWQSEKFMSGTANALQAHPEANCMFVASDFCFGSVTSALKNANKLFPAGKPGHIWIAAQDVNPPGYQALKDGYIDVVTSYDAYFHSQKLVEVIYRLVAKHENLNGKKFLVAGRVVTPQNVDKLPNMWARDYK